MKRPGTNPGLFAFKGMSISAGVVATCPGAHGAPYGLRSQEYVNTLRLESRQPSPASGLYNMVCNAQRHADAGQRT